MIGRGGLAADTLAVDVDGAEVRPAILIVLRPADRSDGVGRKAFGLGQHWRGT